MAQIFESHCVRGADGKHSGGTDKQSNHRYGDAYDALFPDRDAIKLMLEVGIADGACLLAWRDIFPNAHIVGMDIHPCDATTGKRPERLETHRGNQCSKEDCERAAAGRQFDFIVEDAYHSVENTLLTLLWLWPFVKPGGLYVVEEWANIGGCMLNIKALWPDAQIISTPGPFGGDEPLVAFRKPKSEWHNPE